MAVAAGARTAIGQTPSRSVEGPAGATDLCQPVLAGPSLRMLKDAVQGRPAGRVPDRGERQVWGAVCFLNAASVSLSLPRLPRLSAPVSPGLWWWKSSSLCEANDQPLCEAYWRLDRDTDPADGLSAPLLASPEPSAGPLQATAAAHSHAGGPGPTEHT